MNPFGELVRHLPNAKALGQFLIGMSGSRQIMLPSLKAGNGSSEQHQNDLATLFL